MISLKLKFKALSENGREGVLCYQIKHNRATRQIQTNYKIFNNEWSEKSESINLDNRDIQRRQYLRTIQLKIREEKHRFKSLIQKLERQNKRVSINEIVEQLLELQTKITLFKFTTTIISDYHKRGQHRTAETYQSTLNSLKRFCQGEDIELVDFDKEFIIAYEYYLKSCGLQHNTISFYMCRLRAIYNKAVERELIEQRTPFKCLKIGMEKTIKRAIPIRYIKKLKSLKLKEFSSKDLARDMFLFSFYTRGMSFVDIAFLRKKDLKNGVLSYRRKKTGQMLHIRWELCMEQIAIKYKSEDKSPYIFSLLDETKGNIRAQYQNKLATINRNLKVLGREIGLEIPLTTYVARHSWATTARSEGVTISIISEGMGHNNEKTTQIYLASLDNKVIDNANRKIIRLL